MIENTWLNKIVVGLVKKKLGVKDCEVFRFTNQKHDDVYFFDGLELHKYERGVLKQSSVSLNWLLDSNCEIEKME